MINDVEFYNLGEFEEVVGVGTNGLVRIPARIRNLLNERARFIGMDSIGIEIRFVTDAPNIDVFLSALKPEFSECTSVRVYKGNFLINELELEPGKTLFYRINPPDIFKKVNSQMLNNGGFAPCVWRIVCNRSTVIFHGMNTHGYEIRKPRKDELPIMNWLAYGSSITNSHLDGYIHVAANKLKFQVQNKGFSGACHIEKELVDYIVDECDFDFITCELGVNMRGMYTPKMFRERASYLINRLVILDKPAMIITIFPNSDSERYSIESNSITSDEIAYNEILHDLVQQAKSDKLILVQGNELLSDINGLSADLVHPTVYGHAIMGLNLAEKVKEFLIMN